MRATPLPFAHRRLVSEELEPRLCLALLQVSDFPIDNTYFDTPAEATAKLGDRLLFHARDAAENHVLWATTARGEAVQLTRFAFPTLANEFVDGTVFRDRYYFGVSSYRPDTKAVEVWSTDGTAQGTALLFQFDEGPGFDYGTFLGAVDDEFYFAYGGQIMVSDGTVEGTTSFQGSAQGDAIRVGNVSVVSDGNVIWGLSQGTESVLHVGSHRFIDIKVTGNHAYFTDWRLWATDGTPEGTRILLVPPVGTRYSLQERFHDELIVLATNDAEQMSAVLLVNPETTESRMITLLDAQSPLRYRSEVYVIDDRILLTDRIKVASVAMETGELEILPIPEGSLFVSRTSDDFLLIRGTHGGASATWRTDGTPEGTFPLVPDCCPAFAETAEHTYFISPNDDTIQIWRGDHALASSQKFMTIEIDRVHASFGAAFTAQDDFVLLTFPMRPFDGNYVAWIAADADSEFYRVQSLDQGGNWYPVGEVVAQPNHLFLTAGVSDFSLWSVGSSEDQLRNIQAGVAKWTSINDLVSLGNGVLISGIVGEVTSAYTSDGQSLDFLTEMYPYVHFTTPSNVVLFGHNRFPQQSGYAIVDGMTQAVSAVELVFEHEQVFDYSVSTPTYSYLRYGQDGREKYEYWRVTGDMSEVVKVAEGFGRLSVVGDTLLYSCDIRSVCAVDPDLSQWNLRDKIPSDITSIIDGNKYAYLIDADRSLWRTDGTQGGTIKLTDFAFFNLTAAGNKAYFGADDPEFGVRLWETDGTPEGTHVASWWPAEQDLPYEIFSTGGAVYARGASEAEGEELWRIDERSGSALLVRDLWPGPISSAPRNLNVVENDLYFFADDGVHGRQLWRRSHDRLDLNHDEVLDQYDLDAILDSFGLGVVRSSPLDIVADRKIDEIDAAFWLNEVGMKQIGKPYEFGDANLDGSIDATDFGILHDSLDHQTSRWSQGDFNFDSRVDILDFEIWDAQRFQEQKRRPAMSTRTPRAAGATQADVAIAIPRQTTFNATAANTARESRGELSQLPTPEGREATPQVESALARRYSRSLAYPNYSAVRNSSKVPTVEQNKCVDKSLSKSYHLSKSSSSPDSDLP